MKNKMILKVIEWISESVVVNGTEFMDAGLKNPDQKQAARTPFVCYVAFGRLLITCVFAGIFMVANLSSRVQADPKFESWIRDFRVQAQSAGISVELFDEAFANLKPDAEVIRKASYQPEFVTPIWDYIDSRVSATRIENGQKNIKKMNRLLSDIEAKYGVDRHILVAIWGIESAYGAVLDNPKIVKDVVRSLATLAYGDKQRGKYAKRQLIEALKIVQSGDVELSELKGSWAGAMGHTQFIPTTYQEFAVDFDGDGKRNVWTSVPDSLASSANYLMKSGWESGKTWGYEVFLPENFDFLLADETRQYSIGEWKKLNVERASKTEFPRPKDRARMFLPAGANGPAFLLLENFKVIKKYNYSNAYALAVGHLADRLRGGSSFMQPWSRNLRFLTKEEIKTLQAELNRRGFDAGSVDGKIGPGTRRAVRAYQLSLGLVPDGQPSDELLNLLN